MARFMARIELHQAAYQDYVNLHSHMAEVGYSTSIRADTGETYRLPPAEYGLVAQCSLQQALALAQRAAQKTGKRFAAVVCEYDACSWVGLQLLQPRAPVRAY